MKKRYFDLHQFEGEAGGGNSGDASHGESGTTILYGKQAEELANETEPEDGHDAGDNESEEQKRQAEFEKLIKGDYKDLYDKSVKDNIDRRFKNVRESREQIDEINMTLRPIYERYGVELGDVKGLDYAIRNDMSLYADEASELGMTPEQFAYAKRAELEASRAQEELDRMRGAQEAQRTYQGWIAEGEELKQSYPDFDLEVEIQNERFMHLLSQDWTVADAYEAVHAKELIARGIGTAAEKAQQNVVNNIRARGMRPAENGTGSKAGVIVKKDPSQFDNKDMEEIRRRVANGEKIAF